MKNLFFILLIFSTLFSEVCDFNNDNTLNIVDIVIMIDSILNEGEEFCDLNGDGQLNIVDVVQVVNLVLYGMNIEFVQISSGVYVDPGSGNNLLINYDFKISKYEITNKQYLEYLNTAIQEDDIWISNCIDNIGETCVNGFYQENNDLIEKSFFILGNAYVHMLNEYNFGIIDYINSEFQIHNINYIDHPVVNVSWYGANHFAGYYNFRLPKYDEWIKAGKDDLNLNWPWGGGGDMHLKINVLNSQFNIPSDFSYQWGDGTTPVGFYKEQNNMIDNSSPFGVYDIIGNASEWLKNDNEFSNHYKISAGGGWDWGEFNSKLKWHLKYSTGQPHWSTGIRVVKDN
ncbi:MAG: hypothetical protein CMF96_05715 [Candidatus Marinimicrobia bacterium]|nr:hypothetical protein [Candidatus Neomarinimicrobiota bacterium]|tara:strand:+ start:320 stop:1348 length:1029 start_codon:yes stop_codon:yes gene_type:complete